MKADLLIDCANILGEGVQWNADHQRVWWTDIHGRMLWSCDADGGQIERIATPERLGSFAFDPVGHLLGAFESGLFRWDPEKDRLDRLTDFEPLQGSSAVPLPGAMASGLHTLFRSRSRGRLHLTA